MPCSSEFAQRVSPRFFRLAIALVLLLGNSCRPQGTLPPPTLPESASETTDQELTARLDEAILFTLRNRRLNTRDQAAWQVVHGALAYGPDLLIEHEGRDVRAMDYLLAGGKLKGWEFEPGDVLDQKTGRRGLRAILREGSKEGEGHPDQWLGYLSVWGYQPSDTITVEGRTYTLEDYLRQIQLDVHRNTSREYSWTVMALVAYYPTDHQWQASDGSAWSTARLVQSEAEQDINTSACGGTHRLTGLALAVQHRLAEGKPLDGPWLAAERRVAECIETARRLQNPDGSFSSNFLARAGLSADAGVSLGTTGHVFEFLAYALPLSELHEPWMQRAAIRLCDLVRQTRSLNLECGQLYHAMHGLVVYRERLLPEGAPPAWKTQPADATVHAEK